MGYTGVATFQRSSGHSRFWEEGIEGKSGGGKKGIFVIVKTLVGFGGGTVGVAEQGKRLVDYIIDAAKEQLQAEVGKNLSLYPVEVLADRFLKEDVDRYRNDVKKFLRDPKFWEPEEFEDVDKFIADMVVEGEELVAPIHVRSTQEDLRVDLEAAWSNEPDPVVLPGQVHYLKAGVKTFPMAFRPDAVAATG